MGVPGQQESKHGLSVFGVHHEDQLAEDSRVDRAPIRQPLANGQAGRYRSRYQGSETVHSAYLEMATSGLGDRGWRGCQLSCAIQERDSSSLLAFPPLATQTICR